MVLRIPGVLGPEIQSPDHPPLHTSPLCSVPIVPYLVLLFPYCYYLKGEGNLTKIQIKYILASELGIVMGAIDISKDNGMPGVNSPLVVSNTME